MPPINMPRNILRPITISMWAAWLFLSMFSAGRASAQPQLDPSTAMGMYEQVDRWVRGWDLPPLDSPSARAHAVSAVVVTLRLDGRILGRGAAASPDPDVMLLWKAASGAINSVNTKLTNERDAMWEAMIREIAQRITITVEMGSELLPIPASGLALPGFGYSPGSMGFAVRLGELADASGPEAFVISRGDPARSTATMALGLSDDPTLVLQSPSTLSERGFVFYRWQATTLTQPAPGLGAVFADRGGRVIEASEISTSSIALLADQIALHLLGRRWQGVEDYGFMGTLDPVTGKTESPFATPFEQALGAYALLVYGRDAASIPHREAVVAGRDVLRALGRVEPNEPEPWADPLGACMSLIALSELPLEMVIGNKEMGELRTRCVETLDGLYSNSGGFAPSLPQLAHGLVAHALVVSAKLDPRDRSAQAGAAIEQVFLETDPAQLAGQMPFLAWAQLGLVDEHGEIPSRVALRQMRDMVLEHTLHRADLDWVDRDLAGGIVFTSAKAPLPSWSGLRPLVALAIMLGDERLTSGSAVQGEVPMQIGRLVESIRFVRQLAAEGEVMHLFAEVDGAKWGVRMALWDQRMPIESSAMALLMLSETRESFEELMSR